MAEINSPPRHGERLENLMRGRGSVHWSAPVSTLELPQKPLYSIQGGRVDFSTTPSVGPIVVPSDEGWLRVKVSQVLRGEHPGGFEEEDIVCLYLLYYGDEHIKVGTSRLENAVARMFSQAPLVAVVAAVIQLSTELPLESLEKAVIARANELGLRGVEKNKPRLSESVSAWNSVISGRGQLHEKLKAARETAKPLSVLEKLGEVCRVAWKVACKHGEPLYGFASHWFIPECPRKPLPPPLPEGMKLEEGEEIQLKFHPIGLFSVRTGQLTIEGESEFTCDFSFLSRYGFEVMPHE
jgi:hypothetical protein